MQVNLDAVFTLARDVGRHMLEERANTQPSSRGKIVNIASLLSYQGGLTVPAYAAAKVRLASHLLLANSDESVSMESLG